MEHIYDPNRVDTESCGHGFNGNSCRMNKMIASAVINVVELKNMNERPMIKSPCFCWNPSLRLNRNIAWDVNTVSRVAITNKTYIFFNFMKFNDLCLSIVESWLKLQFVS